MIFHRAALLAALAFSPRLSRAEPAAPAPPAFGRLRMDVSGCALAANAKEARRLAVPATRRSAPPVIAAAPGGARVTHRVVHACGFAVEGSLRFEGGTAILQERFTGPSTRCRCETRLVTDLGLKPGTWPVVVVLDLNNRYERVGMADVTVP